MGAIVLFLRSIAPEREGCQSRPGCFREKNDGEPAENVMFDFGADTVVEGASAEQQSHPAYPV